MIKIVAITLCWIITVMIAYWLGKQQGRRMIRIMTYDELLDNEKGRGHIIYRCTAEGCNFRGYGASVFYHEMHNPSHECKNENDIPNNNKTGSE